MRNLILLWLLLPTLLIAQKTEKATVEWGEPLQDKVDGVLSFTVGEYEGAAIQYMYKKKEVFLQRMSADRIALAEQEFEFDYNGDELIFEEAKLFGSEVLVFASFFDKKEGRKSLYIRSFDAETLAVKQKWRKVASIDADKKRNQGVFNIESSPNHTKLLIYHYPPKEKGQPQQVGLEVVNADLETEWEHLVTMKYAEEDFYISSIQVDDDGTVLVLGRLNQHTRREVKEKVKEEKTYYEYHLLVYGPTLDDPKDYHLKLGDKFLQEMNIAIPWNSEDIICSGLYSDEGTWSIRGAYFLKLDRSTKDVLHSSYHEFEDDFITMYMTEKEEAKAKKKAARKDDELEMGNFEMRDVVIREDGGILMVAEQYSMWVTTTTTTDANGNTSTTYTYHYLYRDILVINLSPDGEVEWKARIPKHQYTRNDGGYASSYCMAVVDDNLMFVFNDTGRNLNFKKGETLYRMRLGKKDAIITLVHLNGKGEFTREALVEVEKQDMLCIPKKSTEIGDRILIVAERKKDNQFGTVTFLNGL